MPAINFCVRWPDGTEDICYSPSTVVREHFSAGQTMPLDEFVTTAEQALNAASKRVEQKFGYFCSSAMDQFSSIKLKAARFEHDDTQLVRIISIS
ncbi:MAG: MSMEG_0570 family nitrogen starvation response protein [Pseudomonadota bacterium]|nr:MSMEG_0570 family nitrogen starvation response protein [Pseudomonadota bacterium]